MCILDVSRPVPVTILKGLGKGHVFSIVARVHRYEYPPIIATQQLLNEIDLEKLKGTLIVLPVANPDSFFGRSPFVNPIDKKNLNTTFPGNENGSATQRIASRMTTDVISVSDIFLDIHACDANEDLMPFVCYYQNPDFSSQTKLARDLSEASGFGNIVSYPYTLKPGDSARYAFKQASQNGKVALSFESGKLGTVQ